MGRSALKAFILGIFILVAGPILLPEGTVPTLTELSGLVDQQFELGKASSGDLRPSVTRINFTPTPKTKLEDIRCFRCHKFEEFEEGGDFDHEVHAEDVGHCHKCHAFQGHFESVIRYQTCVECHDREDIEDLIPEGALPEE